MPKFTAFIPSLICLALLTSSAALAANNGPTTINLKEAFTVEGKKKAVIFPHQQHQGKFSCDSCHTSKEGGDAMRVELTKKDGYKNDFHKKLCWPCHIEQKVPKGKSCSTCH